MFYHFAMSVRPPRVLTRSFPLIPAPFTVGVPCSYWTLVCIATLSTLHSLSGQLLQASGLPPASFRPHLTMTPLPLAAPFPLPGGSGTFTLRTCARRAHNNTAHRSLKRPVGCAISILNLLTMFWHSLCILLQITAEYQLCVFQRLVVD